MSTYSPLRLRTLLLIFFAISAFDLSAQTETWERISVLGEQDLRSSDLVDLDGDGDLDVLCRHLNNSGRLIWYINDGMGNYSTGQEINTGDDEVGAYSLIDFDGDEDLDLIITNDNITWLENLGNGSFSSSPNLLIEDHSIAGQYVADFDNDGDLDIAGKTLGN
ncbi:MAG: FG-GAP repeat domain-containing protein, partial [Flavobacteriales bacterium]